MQLIPNREIGFGFVSCSCRACVRACVRACEAVWACEGMCFSSLVARMPGCPGPARLLRGLLSGSFLALRKGFKDCAGILVVCARVLRIVIAA